MSRLTNVVEEMTQQLLDFSGLLDTPATRPVPRRVREEVASPPPSPGTARSNEKVEELPSVAIFKVPRREFIREFRVEMDNWCEGVKKLLQANIAEEDPSSPQAEKLAKMLAFVERVREKITVLKVNIEGRSADWEIRFWRDDESGVHWAIDSIRVAIVNECHTTFRENPILKVEGDGTDTWKNILHVPNDLIAAVQAYRGPLAWPVPMVTTTPAPEMRRRMRADRKKRTRAQANME